jgi:hypothetical protein
LRIGRASGSATDTSRSVIFSPRVRCWIWVAPDLSSGVVEEVITSELFQVPTTAARFGRRLAVVNAKFDTGIPPTADQYEVIVVNR